MPIQIILLLWEHIMVTRKITANRLEVINEHTWKIEKRYYYQMDQRYLASKVLKVSEV